MMRPKIVHLGEKIRALQERKEEKKRKGEKRRRRRGKKEEGKIEEKRRIQVWNLHKFGTSPWYETTINLFLSKLCRKYRTRNVVYWYEMGVIVYFEF